MSAQPADEREARLPLIFWYGSLVEIADVTDADGVVVLAARVSANLAHLSAHEDLVGPFRVTGIGNVLNPPMVPDGGPSADVHMIAPDRVPGDCPAVLSR